MYGAWFGTDGSIRYFWRAPKRARPRCGAKCRDGHPCQAPAVWDKMMDRSRNGRCKLHGGKSTGPRTPEGKARIAIAQRERWQEWRKSKERLALQLLLRHDLSRRD